MIDLYPSIDLRGGRVVRLLHGDFARETDYGDDPVAVAESYAADGAPWVHVVDLDAARGTGDNRGLVAAVVGAVGVPVQVGGGVRSDAAAAALLDAGVARVVVGTAALEEPDLVRRLCAAHPGRVALGLDVRGREVAVRGWTKASGRDVSAVLADVVDGFAGAGLGALVVTQIERDGTLEGPDVDGLATLLASTDVPLVASGGVGTLDDLIRLRGVGHDVRRLAGVIVGRALYEGAFTVSGVRGAAWLGSPPVHAEVATLIVDDEPDMLALLRATITYANEGLFVCGEASDGESALAEVERLDPKVVVLDQRLPGIDGIETARQIRARRPEQTILLFSAFVDDEARRRAAQVGIARCMSKGEVNRIPDVLWELAAS